MSLEKILERIEKDAQDEVDRIKKRASAAADEVIKRAQEEAQALRSQALEKAKSEAEQRRERIISTARLDLRKELLAEKQNAIDAAFREAVESLLNMEDEEYLEVVKGMILSNVQTGDEELILSERDRDRLGEELLEKVNRELTKSGRKGNLTLSQDTYDMLGGFVLRRDNIELNSSFESLFKSFREELELEVSRILFPEP